MLSLDNAYDEADARAFDERLRRALGAGDEALAYVAELKIDGLSIALTYDAAGALVRGVTRGDGVEGEDVTPNVRTIRALPADAGRRRPRPHHRGARRGLPAARVVRAHQPRARGGRGAGVRQRPQRRRRHDADARSEAGRGARPRRVRLSAGRRGRGAGAAPAGTQRARSRRSRAGALPVEPHWRRCDGHRRRARRSAASGSTRGTACRSRPTASSSSWTTSRGASRPGTTSKFPRWAFAYKFPAQQATTKLQGHPRQRRPHRRGDAVRRARAGVPGRLHHRDGDAAQRAGSGAQGHPRRRLRPDRKGRRRDPEGRDVAAAAAADRRRRAAAVGDADHLPDLRHDARPRRRGSGVALREHALSRAPAPQPGALRLAPGDEHRGLRRVAGRSVVDAGLVTDSGRRLPPDRGGAGRARADGRRSRPRTSSREIEQEPHGGAGAGDLRARHPPRRRARRGRAGRGLRLDAGHLCGVAGAAPGACPTWGPSSRRRSAPGSTRRPTST